MLTFRSHGYVSWDLRLPPKNQPVNNQNPHAMPQIADGSEEKLEVAISSETVRIAEVQVNELDAKDVIIAVVGPTGSGKTTFINHITGNNEGVVHGLGDGTTEIKAVRISLANMFSVILVDTPGFVDTDGINNDISQKINKWLKPLNHGKRYLLYFHRISDNRMSNIVLNHLRKFQKLCGSDDYSKISLVTTMWNEVDEATGGPRETELGEEYWSELLEGGASMIRHFQDSREGALSVLNEVLSNETMARIIPALGGLAVLRRRLSDTDVGRQLCGFIENLVERQEELINRMVTYMSSTEDPETIASINSEFEELCGAREHAMAQMAEFKDQRMVRLLRNMWIFNSDKPLF